MYLLSIDWKIYRAGMFFNSTYFLADSISKITSIVKKYGNHAFEKKTFHQPNLHVDKIQLALNTLLLYIHLLLSLDYIKKIKIYATGKKMETLLAVQRCPSCLT